MPFAALFFLAALSSSIEGTVLHSVSNSPVRKATVTLIASHFHLPAGTSKVVASLAGFTDRPAPRPLILGPDAKLTVPPLRLRPRPQGVLAGRVLDEDGDPVPSARLRLDKRTYRDGPRQWSRLNDSPAAIETGDFRIPQLAPVSYLLQALDQRAPANDRYAQPEFVPTYYPSAATEQAALPIEVGVGTDLRGLEIRLVKTLRPSLFRVTGSIIGMPPGMEDFITISGTSGNARPPAYTFELQVPAGAHSILAYASSNPRKAWATGNVNVAADVSGIVLAMNPPPKVTARISLTESDSPISRNGINVSLENFAPSSSDDLGNLDCDLPFGPGQYALAVDPSSLPPNCFVQAVKLDGKQIPSNEVQLLNSTQFEIVLSPNAGTITGTVSDFPGAIVTLIPYFRKRFASNAVEVTVAPRATAKAQLPVIHSPED